MSYAALGSSGYYPSSWRGGMPSQSSSTNHPSGVPSYFPRPPPMPAGYAYGKRAWTSGSWVCMPEPGPGAAHGYQGRWWSNWGSKSTTKDYWSTELKDNPLDLEGMDIRYVVLCLILCTLSDIHPSIYRYQCLVLHHHLKSLLLALKTISCDREIRTSQIRIARVGSGYQLSLMIALLPVPLLTTRRDILVPGPLHNHRTNDALVRLSRRPKESSR